MAFEVWVEIVCGRCSVSKFGRYTLNIIPRRVISIEAEKLGWELRGSTWFCPKCKKAVSSEES